MKSLFSISFLLFSLSFNHILNARTIASEKADIFPVIRSTNQEPPAKRRRVEHQIELSMTAKTPISKIIIEIPRGLEVGSKIIVHDRSGKIIPTDNQVMQNSISITFLEGFQKDEIIEIDLENVIIKGIANAWLYRVSVKRVGNNRLIPIGVASVRIYN
jgi:hypothetical protein